MGFENFGRAKSRYPAQGRENAVFIFSSFRHANQCELTRQNAAPDFAPPNRIQMGIISF